MLSIPTIETFNSWSFQDKLFFINYETEGKYKDLSRVKGYFPFLVYDKQNVGIVYTVDPKGNLIEATAMSVPEAFNRLATFKKASDAVAGASRVS